MISKAILRGVLMIRILCAIALTTPSIASAATLYNCPNEIQVEAKAVGTSGWNPETYSPTRLEAHFVKAAIGGSSGGTTKLICSYRLADAVFDLVKTVGSKSCRTKGQKDFECD